MVGGSRVWCGDNSHGTVRQKRSSSSFSPSMTAKNQAHTVASSYDLRDMLKNVSSSIVNWQIEKWSNCIKLRVLVSMITNSSRRNSNQLENCEMCAHSCLVLRCLYLARIG